MAHRQVLFTQFIDGISAILNWNVEARNKGIILVSLEQ